MWPWRNVKVIANVGRVFCCQPASICIRMNQKKKHLRIFSPHWYEMAPMMQNKRRQGGKPPCLYGCSPKKHSMKNFPLRWFKMAQKRETRREGSSLLAAICNLLIRRGEEKKQAYPASVCLPSSAWRSSLKTSPRLVFQKTAVLVFQIFKRKTTERPVYMDRLRPVFCAPQLPLQM